MNILIVEDERLAAEKLITTIGEIDKTHHIAGTLDSIEGTVDWLKNNPTPDLIFLDIELADGQSFEIFNQVTVKSPLIFTTSYDEYAINAFKVNSVDYLLKPVKKEKLAASFRKLDQLKEMFAGTGFPIPDIKNLIKELQEQNKSNEFRQRFLVKLGQRLVSVETDDIAYFFTDEKVNFFKTKSNMKYIVDYTIDELEGFVDPNKFFRINRQFLIAISSIENIHNYFNGRLLLHLKPSVDKEVIIARERVNEFKDWMGK